MSRGRCYSVSRTAVMALVTALFLSGTARAAQFIRGDVDGNGTLDLTDGIRVFSNLFLSEEIGCHDAADVNDSGEVDISDGIQLLNFLFLGGPPPAVPFPGCGGDETADSLSCETHASCQRFSLVRLALETSGGLSGRGAGNYHLEHGGLRVSQPFGDPEGCTLLLNDDR